MDNVRKKIRRNKFDHLNFNSVLDIEEGQRYYRGIYEPNKTIYKSVDVSTFPDGKKFQKFKKKITSDEFKAFQTKI